MSRLIDADAFFNDFPEIRDYEYASQEYEIDAVLVKHGHWIKNEDRNGWHCSECKEDNYYAYSWSSENGKYEFQDSYCPNCGAKMGVEAMYNEAD